MAEFWTGFGCGAAIVIVLVVVWALWCPPIFPED